jgi:Protein of unknown function (DUF4242)
MFGSGNRGPVRDKDRQVAPAAVLLAVPPYWGYVIGKREGGGDMPVFVVERRFAEELEASAEQADQINRINDEEGVRWLYSFLSADKRKTYCLYEAPFADAIRRAAARAGLPVDSVIEVGGVVLPDGSRTRIPEEVPAD